jgi:hypothetical protein
MSKNLLINKIEDFIKKYYKTLIAKGFIISIGLISAFFLLIAFVEYFFWLSSFTRAALFFSFLALLIASVVVFILVPITKLLGVSKRISYSQAAVIIGNHFPEIKDKLLNTLQLQAKLGSTQSDLLLAEIDKRTEKLSPIKFSLAIDYKQALGFFKYSIAPLAILFFLLAYKPQILKEPSSRLVNFNQEFTPQAPFDFITENDKFLVSEGADLIVNLEISGAVTPNEVFILHKGNEIKMRKGQDGKYSATLYNIRENQQFKFYAAGFYSKNYMIEALPKPVITNFQATLRFPSYTGLSTQTLRNQTEFRIPEGTEVNLNWQTNQIDFIYLSAIGQEDRQQTEKEKNGFSIETSVFNSSAFNIVSGNNKNPKTDTTRIAFEVIKDAHPTISVSESKDSITFKFVSFNGKIQDDYGFTDLKFFYRINEEETFSVKNISFKKDLLNQQFFYFLTLDSFNLNAGSTLNYYFEVADNDQVNGAKRARTTQGKIEIPKKEDLAKRKDEKVKDLDKKLNDAQKKAKELSKELEALNKELLMKKELSWQDKEKIKDLLEKQKNLQKQVENINKEQNALKEMREQFNMVNENILEKQQMLNELFDKLLDDETKKLFEELEKLLDKNDLKDLQNQLEKFEFSAQDLEKELDRNIEMFKSLEVEQKFREIAEELQDLAKEQKDLAEETKNGSTDNETLKEKQEELNKKFEDLKEEFKENMEKNEALETPIKLDDFDDLANDIDNEQQSASDNLDSGDNQKAGENQQNASDKMEEMGNQMAQQLDDSMEQQMGEDAEALRVLLNNIVKLSFDQEDLMLTQVETPVNDPKFNRLAQSQKKLESDGRMVRDSLEALAKRVPQIQTFVYKELNELVKNTNRSVGLMADRKSKEAAVPQQYAMTSINNLALMLSEALENMQQQMQQQGGGSGNCSKPSSGESKSPAQMKAMQEALSKQIEQLKKQMEQQGNQPNGKQRGGQMSEEIAKTAAKQAALRKEIQKRAQELNSDGSGSGKGLNEIAKQMEDNEKDLVNKKIDIETIKRQQDILTRLLEHEKAERERERDEKRKSNQGDLSLKSNPPEFLEYKEKQRQQTELLETLPPSFRAYYKLKIGNYFNAIQP